jgi:hypothetical protein
MNPTIASIAALAATTGLAAQTTIVPSSAATTDPSYYGSQFFYGTTSASLKSESRSQTLYSEADLGSPVLTFKSMEVRRPHYISNQNVAMTGNMQLILSSTSTAPTAITNTYANNHGAMPSTVFNGQINMPARNRGAAWPEPWETPIPFNNTYIFVAQKGGSLVVENIFTNNSTTQPWYVEWHRASTGVRATNLSACSKHSDGGRNSSISYRQPIVGGQWYVSYGSMPSNVPSLNASFQIIALGGVGTQAYGMTLPIPLATFNLPSNSCQLAVQDTVRLPLTYTTSTAGPSRGTLRSPTLTIPNVPAFAGLNFFDQPVAIDTNPTTNTPEIYMGWSSKWTVGSGTGEPMATVYRTGDVANPVGIVQQYGGPSLRFQ